MGTGASREIKTRRILNASRESIWGAFFDADALSSWWGPQGFTNTFDTFDLRPGGEWRFTMRGPDGGEYPMRKIFVEVVAPEKFVFDHPDAVHGHRMSISLREAGNGTEVLWEMLFDSADEAERVRAFVEPANEQNLDRLSAHVAKAK